MLLYLATHSPSVLVQLLKIIRYTYHHQVAWVQVLLFIINICISLTNWPTNWALGTLANVHITTKSQSFTLTRGQGKGHTVAILIHKVCHTTIHSTHYVLCGWHDIAWKPQWQWQWQWQRTEGVGGCTATMSPRKEELRGCDMEDESHSSAQWIPALVQDKQCLPFLLS